MTEQFIYGIHAVFAILNNPHRVVHNVFVSKNKANKKIQDILGKAEELKIKIDYLDAAQMEKRFAQASHQGIAAQASPLPEFGESDLISLLEGSKKTGLILILDGITDPHNLGACLRSADAAGVDFVIIPKDKSASITPAVSKVACGAAESVPLVRVTNLVRAMELLKAQGVWIYGAAGEATQSLYQIDCSSTVALVMGAEEEGMRRLTREHCDGLFSLPMLGAVSSLNVSVATGISLYEVLRQRQKGAV